MRALQLTNVGYSGKENLYFSAILLGGEVVVVTASVALLVVNLIHTNLLRLITVQPAPLSP